MTVKCDERRGDRRYLRDVGAGDYRNRTRQERRRDLGGKPIKIEKSPFQDSR